jgi:hypothetical protein
MMRVHDLWSSISTDNLHLPDIVRENQVVLQIFIIACEAECCSMLLELRLDVCCMQCEHVVRKACSFAGMMPRIR